MREKLRKIWLYISIALIITIAPILIYWGMSDIPLGELIKGIWGLYAPIVFFIFGFIVGFKFTIRAMLSDNTGLE